MPDPKPKRTGTIHRYAPPKPGEPTGHYVVRCSAPDGTRPLFHLDPSPESQKAREAALRTAEAITERIWTTGEGATPKRERATRGPSTGGETVEDYSARWFDDRERRGLSSVGTDRGRMKLHVLPVMGGLPIGDVTPDHLRAIVERLDDTVRAEKLHWSTARKVWGLVTKMFSDACKAKVQALRVRKDNPSTDVTGPDDGEPKAKQWLYPGEMCALLACPEVPLRWRQLYAIATYLYLRPGELAALEWADVHLELGYVNIHQALSMRSGQRKPTKTGITRKVPIQPSLGPMLRALAGSGRVVQHTHENKKVDHGLPPLEDLADTLRRHLERAGVKRADLFADRSTTKRITFYDLRATGITWEVLAGTEHVRVMQRAGHKNFTTTLGCVREAETLGLSVGDPFPALPESLSQQLPQEPERSATRRKRSTFRASPTGFEPVLQP